MTLTRTRIRRNRWKASVMRWAIRHDFVRYARLQPRGEPLHIVWGVIPVGPCGLHIHFGEHHVASIGTVEVRPHIRYALLRDIAVHHGGTGLELALIEGFAKALRKAYGITSITFSEKVDALGSSNDHVFLQVGTVKTPTDDGHQQWVWKTDEASRRSTRLDFRPDGNVALDQGTGIRILLSRLQGSGPAPGEYEYVHLKGKQRVGVAGFQDRPDKYIDRDGQREAIYSLDMTHRATIERMLRARETLITTDTDYDFLRGLALGYLLAAASGVRSCETVHYVAITTPMALAWSGVSLPDEVPVADDGTVELAEVLIPPAP
jgi:hypothetical protein